MVLLAAERSGRRPELNVHGISDGADAATQEVDLVLETHKTAAVASGKDKVFSPAGCISRRDPCGIHGAALADWLPQAWAPRGGSRQPAAPEAPS